MLLFEHKKKLNKVIININQGILKIQSKIHTCLIA